MYQKWSRYKNCKLLIVRKYKLSTKNGVATKFQANFCLCSFKRKNILTKKVAIKSSSKVLLVWHKETSNQKWSKNLHNFRVNFCLCSKRKKSPPKNGVATKFMANFCLCSIRKKSPPKMEMLQNLWQTFACVALEKPSQKWSYYKFYGKCKIFLMAILYIIFKYGQRFRLHSII